MIRRSLLCTVALILAIPPIATSQIRWSVDRWTSPTGGTVLSAALTPDGDRLYVGTLGGGVFRTHAESGGLVPFGDLYWEPAGMLAGDSVHAVLPWSRRTVLAASDSGIFYSRDSGDTWLRATMSPTASPVLVLWRSGAMLLAGTHSGAYRSLDSGATWQRMNGSTRPVHAFVRDLTQRIHAATDDGLQIYNELSNTWYTATLSATHISALAIDRTGTMFAATPTALLRRAAAATDWQPTATQPSSPIRVLAFYQDTLLAAGCERGVHISRNNGASWQTIGNAPYRVHAITPGGAGSWNARIWFETIGGGWIGSPAQTTIALEWNPVPVTHATSMCFEPRSGRSAQLAPAGFPALNLNHGSYNSAKPDTILRAAGAHAVFMHDDVQLVGTTDGTVLRSSNEGKTWIPIMIARGFRTGPFVMDENGFVCAATDGLGVARSNDVGLRWTLHPTGVDDNILCVGALPSGRILAGTPTGLLSGTADGQNWYQVPISAGRRIEHIAAQRNGLALASAGSELIRTTNNGVTWSTIPAPTSPVTALHITLEGMMLAGGMRGAIMVSRDSGATWTRESEGLRAQTVTCFGEQRWGRLFVGTTAGVLISDSVVVALPQPRVRLLNPADGARYDKGVIRLTWETMGAPRYQVQIARDSLFQNKVRDVDTTGGAFMPQGLANGGRYFWRVRGLTSPLATPWSLVRSFVIDVPTPEAPGLLDPDDNEANIPLTHLFKWDAGAFTEEFEIQVATSVNFSTIVAQAEHVTTMATGLSGMDYNSTYYWRVRGVNTYGVGPWSAVYRFHTQIRVPSPPVLRQPGNGVTQVPTTVMLSWLPSNSAVDYRVQVSTLPGFHPMHLDTAGITGTSLQLRDLVPATRYYWRVLGRNSLGEGLWASAWNFVTDDGKPAAITLVAPDSGAMRITRDALVWNRDARALRYELQVATDDMFGTIVLNQTALVDTTFTLPYLAPGIWHWWRVRATGTSGAGAWSEIRPFRTRKSVPLVPRLLAPHDTASGLPLRIALSWEASAAVEEYDVAVAEDDAFSVIVADTTTQATTWLTPPLAASRRHVWRVRACTDEDTTQWSAARSFTTASTTEVDASAQVASLAIELHPHPVLTRSVAIVTLQRYTHLRLVIVDALGRQVGVLHDGMLPPGRHALPVDAGALPPGLYQLRPSLDARAAPAHLFLRL